MILKPPPSGGGEFTSVYHLNAIQSWHVSTDGEVTNVHA